MKLHLLFAISLLSGCASPQGLRQVEQEFVGRYKGFETQYPASILILELKGTRAYILSDAKTGRAFEGEWKEDYGYIVAPAPGNPGWSLKISREGKIIVLSSGPPRAMRFEKVE